MHVRMYMYVYMCACVNKLINKDIYIYVHICICIDTHLFLRIIYIYIYYTSCSPLVAETLTLSQYLSSAAKTSVVFHKLQATQALGPF